MVSAMSDILLGRGAIVTGASRGLGLEVARALAVRGARVAMVARSEEELARAAAEVARAAEVAGKGGQAHALAFDVAKKEDTHRIAGAASAVVGPIDVLVHGAGTLGPVPLRPLGDTDCEDLERAFAVNALGPFRLTKAVLGSMTVRRTGAVVFVSSDAAMEAYPTWGAYGATKAAQDHLARTFAAETEGPVVLAIDPGEMDTKMHADAMPEADRASLVRPEAIASHVVALVVRALHRDVQSGTRLDTAALREVRA